VPQRKPYHVRSNARAGAKPALSTFQSNEFVQFSTVWHDEFAGQDVAVYAAVPVGHHDGRSDVKSTPISKGNSCTRPPTVATTITAVSDGVVSLMRETGPHSRSIWSR
jgi:hypothetical protein